MIQKYFEEEIQNIVFGIRRRKRECTRKVNLKAYKLYFGFKDCLLVKTLSIGIKVSSRN